MLEVAILGLLEEQDMHGYELRRRLGELLGPAAGVSFGSVYPALARLLAAGAVRVLPAPEADRLVRRRKVYSLTAQGGAMFQELLSATATGAADERSFRLVLAFASRLPRQRRLWALEQRRSALSARLTELLANRRDKTPGRYAELLSQRELEYLSRDLSWLDRLIEEERGSRPTGIAAQLSEGRPCRQTPVPLASASQLQRHRRGALCARC